MADFRKAIEITRGLTDAIKGSLSEEDEFGSEQVVWTYELGNIVTTKRFGENVRFKIIGFVNVNKLAGYKLRREDASNYECIYPEISLTKVSK
jgi:hypothetical protein